MGAQECVENEFIYSTADDEVCTGFMFEGCLNTSCVWETCVVGANYYYLKGSRESNPKSVQQLF